MPQPIYVQTAICCFQGVKGGVKRRGGPSVLQAMRREGGYIPFEVSFRLWLAMTVAGDAGGPVGSAAVVAAAVGSCPMAKGGGDSDEGVPELDIICVKV